MRSCLSIVWRDVCMYVPFLLYSNMTEMPKQFRYFRESYLSVTYILVNPILSVAYISVNYICHWPIFQWIIYVADLYFSERICQSDKNFKYGFPYSFIPHYGYFCVYKTFCIVAICILMVCVWISSDTLVSMVKENMPILV